MVIGLTGLARNLRNPGSAHGPLLGWAESSSDQGCRVHVVPVRTSHIDSTIQTVLPPLLALPVQPSTIGSCPVLLFLVSLHPANSHDPADARHAIGDTVRVCRRCCLHVPSLGHAVSF